MSMGEKNQHNQRKNKIARRKRDVKHLCGGLGWRWRELFHGGFIVFIKGWRTAMMLVLGCRVVVARGTEHVRGARGRVQSARRFEIGFHQLGQILTIRASDAGENLAHERSFWDINVSIFGDLFFFSKFRRTGRSRRPFRCARWRPCRATRRRAPRQSGAVLWTSGSSPRRRSRAPRVPP